jgi:DNA adenine methylase
VGRQLKNYHLKEGQWGLGVNSEQPTHFDNKGPPLVKWPGGKRALVPHILPLLPGTFGRFYEPFVGSGALFFAIQPDKATLSDTNAELINLYTQVRDHPDDLIKVLRKYRNSANFYYGARSSSPRLPLTRAARFLYLLTLSFNGIHRVNLRGVFNVPYGFKTHLPTHDEQRIRLASRALAGVTLTAADFAKATARARNGDLIYFDPPYTVAHAHNGFVKYNEKIFSWNDQTRLAEHARVLVDRGCHIFVSNADHPSVAKLYRGFRIARIKRFSVIAASSDFRRPITETVYYMAGA